MKEIIIKASEWDRAGGGEFYNQKTGCRCAVGFILRQETDIDDEVLAGSTCIDDLEDAADKVPEFLRKPKIDYVYDEDLDEYSDEEEFVGYTDAEVAEDIYTANDKSISCQIKEVEDNRTDEERIAEINQLLAPHGYRVTLVP